MDKLTDPQKEHVMEAGKAALNMSHGIKNIAQSMRSGGEVMDKALQTGDLDIAKRTWPILRQSLARIEKLSLDMLTFSADQTPELKPCDFNRLVESVVQRLRPQADQRQVTLSTEPAEPLPQAPMDAEQMTDVVMNLLINAIEAVDADTGKVTVRIELDKRANQVILCIRDNGPGIENADKIFEPFYTTKSNLGAGLGLAIARKIVQNHNGTITVQSAPHKGSTFTVHIPTTANNS